VEFGICICYFPFSGRKIAPLTDNNLFMKTKTARKVIKRARRQPVSYDAVKTFNGRQYTGMQIGRSHKWYYDKGEWKEKKITPDMWAIHFAVTKRRAGKAPKGSGVPVGSGYHWYIMAHQNVIKLNADDYTTVLSGLKFKLAHKRAVKNAWSASAAAQRKTLISFLKELAANLEKQPIELKFGYGEKEFKGEAIPLPEACQDGVCHAFDITLNGEHMGIIHRLKNSWKMEAVEDPALIKAIGNLLDE
jgi:hypothetical protein